MKRYTLVVALAFGVGLGIGVSSARSQQEGTELKAPVRVVNDAGKTVLEITSKGNLNVYGSHGRPIAGLGPNDSRYFGMVFYDSRRGMVKLGDQ